MSKVTSRHKVLKIAIKRLVLHNEADVTKIGVTEQDVRKVIGAQGDDNRKTMEKEDELVAKKSNRQQARARSLARSF